MNPESVAILKRLAGAKKPCGDCLGTKQALNYAAVTDLIADLQSATDTRGVPVPCPICKGTGEVLRFPMLSKQCSNCGGFGVWPDSDSERKCWVCAGTRRVPITENVLEAVLDCLVEEGNRYCGFQYQPAGNVFCFTAPFLSIASYRQPTEGQDHLEAALRALGKVKVIE